MSGSSLSVTLFALVSSVVALAAFLWAIRHRQMRGSEEAKFTMFEAGTTLATQPRPWTGRMWIMAAVITMVFGFIIWSVVVTIIAANHTPIQPPDAAHPVASPM